MKFTYDDILSLFEDTSASTTEQTKDTNDANERQSYSFSPSPYECGSRGGEDIWC